MAKKEVVVNYTKPLENARYERFSQEYVKDPNATKAAKNAKYSKRTAYSQGQRLLKNVEVKGRIAYLQSKLSEETGIDAKMVIMEFAKIGFTNIEATVKHQDKIKALENLGKHLGIYAKDNSQKGEAMKKLLDLLD